MAVTVTDRGTGQNFTGGGTASTAMSPTSTIAAGSTGVLLIGADNSNASSSNFPNPITDSVGNVWRRRVNAASGTANNALESAIYTSNLTTQLTSSNNVTVTYTAANVPAKCWAFVEIAPNTAGNIMVCNDSGSGNASGTTTLATATSGFSVNMVVVALGIVEDASTTFTQDTDTSNGSWSTHQTTNVGTTTTGIAISSQWKIQTTTISTQTYNLTSSVSADLRSAWVSFTEASPKTRTMFQTATGQATTTWVFTDPMASGSTCVFLYAGDNSAGTGNTQNLPTPTVNDSVGNTWTRQQDGLYDPGAAGAGVEIGMYTSTLTNAISQGDTIAFTYTSANVGNKAMAVLEFSDATALANSGLGTGNTNTSPTVTTGSITNGNYVIGVLGFEGTVTDSATGDADTTNGSWSTFSALAAGTGGSANGIAYQYKKVTATATQTFNPTIPSNDWMTGWVELTSAAAGGETNTSSAFALFFP